MGSTRTTPTKRLSSKNPFVFDRFVDDSDLMIRREKALSWVSNTIKETVNLPLTIEGVPGIGRTTFLKQLQRQANLLQIVPIYFNLSQSPLHSFSEFLWAFGKTIVVGLTDAGLPAPPLEKRMLVLRPWQAFRQLFWQQLVTDNHGRRLLIILDDFEKLTKDSSSAEFNRTYRQYLYDLTQDNQDILVLFSLAGRVSGYNPRKLVPFDQCLRYRLSPFTESQTFDLISQNHEMNIQRSTASYIYSLTLGHPADTQRLCHAIYERLHVYKFKVITVADVVSTLRTEVKPVDFRKPVHRRRSKLSYPPKSDRGD